MPPVAYARSLVEYCSYVALRAETRRRHDHLGDRDFHSLTYDMMLACEAPDQETEAGFQKTAFNCDGTDDDSGSIFYSSPTQMAIQVGSRLAWRRNYAAKDIRFIVDARALMLGCSGLG